MLALDVKRSWATTHYYWKQWADPALAASFFLGQQAHSTAWRSIQGATLTQVYPGSVVFRIVRQEPKVPSTRTCNAIGRYHPNDNSFTLLAGSLLSFATTPSFADSGLERYRTSLIETKCEACDNCYKLKEDIRLKSSSLAASIVLGRHCSGREGWKDENGNTLNELFPVCTYK